MRRILLLILPFLPLVSCAPPPSAPPSAVSVVPRPAVAEAHSGSFTIDGSTTLAVENGDSSFQLVAGMTADLIRRGAGVPLPFASAVGPTHAIVFRRTQDLSGDESYRLDITPERVTIEARSGAGAFYGMQTLRQMMPPDVETAATAPMSFALPCAHVEDAPRYPYRGLHLDVARHFFPVAFLKKYLDLMAMHKLNKFHWHLTDDQGWRIEIKRYPKLTSVGAWRNATLIGHASDKPWKFDSTRYGGFYTQNEVREVVRYAADRFITVIPEIEMPGHAMAALAAYPELSCTGGPFTPSPLWGVFEDVYCTKDSVFDFEEGVLTEVMDLFPSQYIHIGGDEVPKTRWAACPQCQAVKKREGLTNEHELQSYFVRRVEKFLNDHGRRIIGWDEILEGGLAPNATVMSWRGTEGGIEAARQRHDVIMTPGSHCYLDHYQARSADEPLAIGGYLPLQKVYSYEPTPEELSPAEAVHVLGAQGNVWTEYIGTPEHAEYMVYPRAAALAEVVWSPPTLRDFDDFAKRLARHLKRLTNMGVHAANHLFDVRTAIGPASEGVTLSLSTLQPNVEIRYTLDGSEPSASSPVYVEPLAVRQDVSVRAAGFAGSERVTRPASLRFTIHAAAGKPISLAVPPSAAYGIGGRQALVNGVQASDDRYGDGEWLAWSGADLDATIDLQEARDVRSVHMRFYLGLQQWIWPPSKVDVLVSDNGSDFQPAATAGPFDAASMNRTIDVTMPLSVTHARFIKVVARGQGSIPEGNPGAGNPAWLFVDEIVVR